MKEETKRMQSLVRKFALNITAFTLVWGVVSMTIYNFVFPQFYLTIYPWLLVFFYLFGFIGVEIYSWSLKHIPAKAAVFYLGVRILKMLISILGALIYCIVDRAHAIVFLLTFVIVYMVYLFFETRFYYTFENSQKKQKKNDKANT